MDFSAPPQDDKVQLIENLHLKRDRCFTRGEVGQDFDRLTYVSQGFCRHTGYSEAECVGRSCRFLQGPDTDPAAVQAIRAALNQGAAVHVDILNYRKDGRPFWNRLFLRPLVPDPKGGLRLYLGLQEVIPAASVRAAARIGPAAITEAAVLNGRAIAGLED